MSTQSGQKYQQAAARLLEQMNRAYLENSTPVPHPKWYMRLLRAPHRKVDFDGYVKALHALKRSPW